MMASTTPYRLQVLLDRDVRKVLRQIAYQEDTSMQQLVSYWIVQHLRTYPAGEHLPPEPLRRQE